MPWNFPKTSLVVETTQINSNVTNKNNITTTNNHPENRNKALELVLAQIRDMQCESQERFFGWEERRQQLQHEFDLQRQQQLGQEVQQRQKIFADLISQTVGAFFKNSTSNKEKSSSTSIADRFLV